MWYSYRLSVRCAFGYRLKRGNTTCNGWNMKWDIRMVVLNYADFTNKEDISDLCRANTVIFDFKLYDIPKTMRRNVKTCANLGANAVTVADDAGNCMGIAEAKKAGDEYGIRIIVGDIQGQDRE